MKRLFLVRHAKSSWNDTSLSDWERPLNKRGKRDAPEMGRRLSRAAVNIDAIISSTAVRAISTADILAEQLLFDQEIDQRDDLYHAGAGALLNVIRQFDDAWNAVMLVAHNPGLTDLVNKLSGPIDNVPTCGIVTLDYDIDHWRDVGRVAPIDFQFDFPKNKPIP